MKQMLVGVKKSPLVITKESIALFWGNVKIKSRDDCWNWTATTNKFGYGQLKRSGVTMRAHRFSYMIKLGQIPDGMCVLHRCDNPLCCNPKHLFLGTKKQNSEDMVKKGRQASGDKNGARKHPERHEYGDYHWARRMPHLVSRGSKCGASKVTEAVVVEMRREFPSAMTSYRRFGSKYGLSAQGALDIISRKTWKHVP